MLKQHADVHASIDEALRWAAINGHLDIVKILVENGADIHAFDDEALVSSAARGHLAVVEYLGSQGANLRAQNDYALIWSTTNGYIEIVKYLLANGVPVNKFCTQSVGFRKTATPEDFEVIAQYFPPLVPEELAPKKFHDYALKYGIVYHGSNYPPMEEEYKKRKEIRSKLKKEIYEKAQEILYRPGGIRSLLLEERFHEKASKCVE